MLKCSKIGHSEPLCRSIHALLQLMLRIRDHRNNCKKKFPNRRNCTRRTTHSRDHENKIQRRIKLWTVYFSKWLPLFFTVWVNLFELLTAALRVFHSCKCFITNSRGYSFLQKFHILTYLLYSFKFSPDIIPYVLNVLPMHKVLRVNKYLFLLTKRWLHGHKILNESGFDHDLNHHYKQNIRLKHW